MRRLWAYALPWPLRRARLPRAGRPSYAEAVERFLAGEIDFDTLSTTLRAAAAKSAEARARVEQHIDEVHAQGGLNRQLKHALRAGLDTSRRVRRLPDGAGGRSPLADLIGDAKAASEVEPASLARQSAVAPSPPPSSPPEPEPAPRLATAPAPARPAVFDPPAAPVVPPLTATASAPVPDAPPIHTPARPHSAPSPSDPPYDPPPGEAPAGETRASEREASETEAEEWAPAPRPAARAASTHRRAPAPTVLSPLAALDGRAGPAPQPPTAPRPDARVLIPDPAPTATQAGTAQAGAADPDDEPTIPLVKISALAPVARLGEATAVARPQGRPDQGGPPPAARARSVNGAAAVGDVEARVQDAYLTNYLARFTDQRGLNGTQDGARRGDEHVDRLLSSWKSIRDRRSARDAAAGRPVSAEPDLSAAAVMPLRVGSLLKDRFVLEAELGGGGVGRVFKAVDRRKLETGSREPYVAIKILRERLARDPDAVRALEHEARKTQSLSHPNIVNIHDFDRDGARVFMAMELIEGRSLSQCFAQWPADGLDPEAAAPILRAIGAGLGHAHANGFAHADVKPANVMLLTDGRVKLLDFGLVAALREAGPPAEAAMDGLTPLYASPERLAGAGPSICDDVFAFGSVAYRVLSGRHPFGRQPADEAQRAGLAPRPIERLGPAANAALRAALAFDPAERPGTVAEFVDGLATA